MNQAHRGRRPEAGMGTSVASGSPVKTSSHALLIIDLISDFAFPDGELLIRPALRAAKHIAQLKARASAHGVPCIYVNDNGGNWQSDRAELVRKALSRRGKVADIIHFIRPDPDDYFIVKPRHSGFFATPLHTLLNQIAARTLVVTGVTTHQCVLFTSVDAHMRDFRLVIPRDCVASVAPADSTRALAVFKRSLHALTPRGAEVRFSERKTRVHKPSAT